MTDVSTRELLGVPIALTDYDAAIGRMDGLIEAGERGYVCAAAVHVLMVAQHDPAVLAALRGATMVLPDGQPLVWALGRLGARLEGRVYGPELMRRYCAHAASRGTRLFLFGGRSASALAGLERVLRERNPGIQVVGSWRPACASLDDLIARPIADRINDARADVVWVGLGAPRQELWMAAMQEKLNAPVLVGVGAAFDFLAGLKRQAPAWMQRRGLEWLFRLAQEPRRLGPRYLRYNPAFALAVARQLGRERRLRTP